MRRVIATAATVNKTHASSQPINFPLHTSFSRSFFPLFAPCDLVLFICFHRLIYFYFRSFFFASVTFLPALYGSLFTECRMDLPSKLDIHIAFVHIHIFIADVGFFFRLWKQFYVLSNIASFCFIIKKLLLII